MKKLKAVLIDPETETVQDVEVENDLHALQEIVGGYIETVSYARNSKHVLIVNEEGTFRSFKVFAIKTNKSPFITVIHGKALMVNVNRDDFADADIDAKAVEKIVVW